MTKRPHPLVLAAARLAIGALLLAPLSPGTARAFGEKRPFRVAITTIEPFVIFERGHYTGFSIELWDRIARMLNLEYTLVDSATIDGLIETVHRGDADAGIAAISMTSGREKIIDFSCPYFLSGLQIMVPRGTVPRVEYFLPAFFMLLFSHAGRIFAFIGAIMLIVLATAHIVWLCERHHNPSFSRGYLHGIMDALWWSAQTFTSVGYGDKTPQSLLGRMFGMLWMFIGCILFAYLTASVTTNLTLKGIHRNIDSPDDLVGKRIATVRGSTADAYLAAEMIHPLEFDGIAKACEAMEAGRADAIVFDSPVLAYYAAHIRKGRVMLVGSVFQKELYGIALRPASPYREAINCAILTLLEDGTYDRLYEKWFGAQDSAR